MVDVVETVGARRVVSDAERKVFEWESSLHDRSDARYMNESRERTLLEGFLDDVRFRNMVLVSLGDPGLSHAGLLKAYADSGAGSGVEGMFLESGWEPDGVVLAGVDADLRRLADDAPDRSRVGVLWSFRGFVSWLLGDVEDARLKVAAASVVRSDGDTLGVVVASLLRMGVGVGGVGVPPVELDF